MSKRITEFNDNIPENMKGCWQVSDKAPKEIIQEFTKDCDREDCHVSYRYAGGTMLGTSSYYDKQGQLHIKDDNSLECYLCCRQCWKMKKARSWVKYDEQADS